MALQDLNLDSVPLPQNTENLHSDEFLQRRALKLYHMIWSGITKYIRSVCLANKYSIEIHGFGIFKPEVINKQEIEGSEVKSSKLTNAALSKLQDE